MSDTPASDEPKPKLTFGEALRDARELHLPDKWTQAQLARAARTSKSTISRLENNVPPIPPHLPAVFDQLFGTDGLFQRLYDENRADSFPARYRRAMELEAKAVVIDEYAGHMVPGLCQTSEYALALLRAGSPRAPEAELRRAATARVRRQSILTAPNPPDLSVILDEAVVRRPVGGPAVMRGQLAALLRVGQLPHINVQVAEFSHGEHGLLGGSLILFTLPDGKQAAYEEGITTASLDEESESVRRHRHAYDCLRGDALSARDSREMLRTLMEALPNE
ncbi:Scr1 family TA system antitoxin-like transcriptional regulator [Streptomyces sp. NPDC087440]|uniref:helix-turn-helix domain-containing protein n=1 Tax=Streptomyces sp. NPDC087440 TaxID=3365790 RepID=UPI003805A42F